MTKEEIKKLVKDEIENYCYEEVYNSENRSKAIGVPWSKEKVMASIKKLKEALVEPYLEEFELRDTVEHIDMKPPLKIKVWVVADNKIHNPVVFYKIFYDIQKKCFGLIDYNNSPTMPPHIIGIYGDLVGVYGGA